jgi:C-terminal processing protease CtpA/Prc
MLLSEIMNRERAARSGREEASATFSTADSPLELKFLDKGVAYLAARTFDYDLEKYKALLVDSFTQIKAAGARRLIIDLRENDGGNSQLGDALIDMFNAKPYRDFAGQWKRSDLFAEQVKSNGAFASQAEKYLAARPGEMISNEFETINPGANPLRFGGQVYVLSGARTFSSGMMFLGIVKANRLATIVGEETNEPACHFGEVMNFKLPHSGLRASVSVKSWTPPGGCKGTRGVLPDVEVKKSVADYLTGSDRILETALKLIQKRYY